MTRRLTVTITIRDNDTAEEEAAVIEIELSDLGVHVHASPIVGDEILLGASEVDAIGRMLAETLGAG